MPYGPCTSFLGLAGVAHPPSVRIAAVTHMRSSFEWRLYKRYNKLQGIVKARARAKGSILGCSFCGVALC
jgi:hypothetical protein